MLFLGVTKHLLVHVVHLFGNKNTNYWTFCEVISEQIKNVKDISFDWCPITDFVEAESISTTGWQFAQYIAFSRLSLVYVGLIEDFENTDKKMQNISTSCCTLVPSNFFFIHWWCLQLGACWWLYKAIFILLRLLWDINQKLCQKPSKKEERKIGMQQFYLETLQTISVCWTWNPWLIDLVHQETSWKEKRNNSLCTSKKSSWIQYVTLKPTCPVCWIIFFAPIVYTVSWETINIIMNQKLTKQGTSKFTRVTMHLRMTFKLEKFYQVL